MDFEDTVQVIEDGEPTREVFVRDVLDHARDGGLSVDVDHLQVDS